MRYELYYWPSIQGRGEFVRLALEDAGADYVDVARGFDDGAAGRKAVMTLLNGEEIERPPYAPPFLKAGKLIVGQTANILLYLGGRLGLAPEAEAGRLWAHQLQLTFTDWVLETHDTHHPISNSLYYEDQKPEAKRRTEKYLELRAPKYLGYYEKVIDRNKAGKGKRLVGAKTTYPDLSLFQMVEGLRYAFPNAMAKLEKSHPRVVAVHDEVAARKGIEAYLASPRRIAFNEMGIFRRYPELDS